KRSDPQGFETPNAVGSVYFLLFPKGVERDHVAGLVVLLDLRLGCLGNSRVLLRFGVAAWTFLRLELEPELDGRIDEGGHGGERDGQARMGTAEAQGDGER